MSCDEALAVLSRWRDRLVRLEETLLVVLVLGMIVLAVLQIILRNTLGTGMLWSDTLIRILVLWTGLIGATLASRSGRHIAMDLAGRCLPENVMVWIRVVTDLFAAVVCGIVAYFCVKFVVFEADSGRVIYAGVPSWVGTVILPAAFALIATRYFVSALLGVSRRTAAP